MWRRNSVYFSGVTLRVTGNVLPLIVENYGIQDVQGFFIRLDESTCRKDCTVAEKDKPPMLADFTATVIFLFSARNFAAPQDKS